MCWNRFFCVAIKCMAEGSEKIGSWMTYILSTLHLYKYAIYIVQHSTIAWQSRKNTHTHSLQVLIVQLVCAQHFSPSPLRRRQSHRMVRSSITHCQLREPIHSEHFASWTDMQTQRNQSLFTRASATVSTTRPRRFVGKENGMRTRKEEWKSELRELHTNMFISSYRLKSMLQEI